MTNHADTEGLLIDLEKMDKSDRIQILWPNYMPQRHFKRRYLCQDQSSMELFLKKRALSKQLANKLRTAQKSSKEENFKSNATR